MMKLLRRKEDRNSVADVVIQQIINASNNASAEADASATAAVEACSGLIQRGLMAARIVPETVADMYGLTPHLLGAVGRALARRGECILYINRARMTITAANTHTITGRYPQDSWRYELTFQGPSRSTTIRGVRADDVLHFRWAYDLGTPWRGVGPLQSASLDARIVGAISWSLGNEFLTPHGFFIPIPKTGGQDASVVQLRSDIKGAEGSSLLVESMADSWQTGGRGQVNNDWNAKRFGADPPATISEIWSQATKAIISAYGLPPALFSDDGATNTRESWRMALFSLLNPLGRMIEEEMSMKLGTGVELDYTELQASDLQGRARAFKSLIDGGMDVMQASKIAGF